MRTLLLAAVLFTGCVPYTGALYDHYGVRHQYSDGAMPTLKQLERSWLMDEYVINSVTGYRGATRIQIEQCLWDTEAEIVPGDSKPCEIDGKQARCYVLESRRPTGYSIEVTERACWYDSAYVHEMAHMLQECLHTVERDYKHEESFFWGPRGFVGVWADTTRTGERLCDIMNLKSEVL